MNVNWVFADSVVLDPAVDLIQLKEIGSFWGGWRTWRGCQTDNVICHDLGKAKDLIQRDFHNGCNFYVPNSSFALLDRPTNVKLYEGNFIHDVDHQEEIIAMHLAATTSDIVLLMGFNFSSTEKNPDKLIEHRLTNYRNLTRQAIKDNPQVQWVVIDHFGNFRKELLELENLSKDTLDNVIGMLAN